MQPQQETEGLNLRDARIIKYDFKRDKHIDMSFEEVENVAIKLLKDVEKEIFFHHEKYGKHTYILSAGYRITHEKSIESQRNGTMMGVASMFQFLDGR